MIDREQAIKAAMFQAVLNREEAGLVVDAILALQPQVTDQMTMKAVEVYEQNKLRIPYVGMRAALEAALSLPTDAKLHRSSVKS